MPSPHNIVLTSAAVALIAIAGTALAEPPHPQGAVTQQGGVVPQTPTLPELHLNNTQRELIRQAVLPEPNEIEFKLKSTKAAKDFNPQIGATLPKGIVPQGFPTPVLTQLPPVRDYGYVKMKDQVLIVNAMTRKIVDLFPETQPLN